MTSSAASPADPIFQTDLKTPKKSGQNPHKTLQTCRKMIPPGAQKRRAGFYTISFNKFRIYLLLRSNSYFSVLFCHSKAEQVPAGSSSPLLPVSRTHRPGSLHPPKPPAARLSRIPNGSGHWGRTPSPRPSGSQSIPPPQTLAPQLLQAPPRASRPLLWGRPESTSSPPPPRCNP